MGPTTEIVDHCWKTLQVKAIVWLPGVRLCSALASFKCGHLGNNGCSQFALKHLH